MKLAGWIAAALFAAMPLAAQTAPPPADAPEPRCGEPCLLVKVLRELHSLPPLPSPDPMPGDALEPTVRVYSDCTVAAFRKAGGDWSASAGQIDAALDTAFGTCLGERLDAAARIIGHFDTAAPGLSAAQKRIYTGFVIGMHGLSTLIEDAASSGRQDAARTYLRARIDQNDLSHSLLYFDVGD